MALAIPALAAAQGAAPFSHRTHLGLKLECGACHAAALTSTRLDDNLLPAREVCLKCHKTAIIPPAPATKLARFNHQLHITAQIACVTCHRDGARAQMAGCLVCHNQIDPPTSCEFCHPKDAALKPANHTPDFLDTHTSGNSGLDKTTCAVCHGRHFRCMGCH